MTRGRNILTIIFAVLALSLSYCQDNARDSLLTIAKGHAVDTVRINVYATLINEHATSQEQLDDYYQRARAIVTKSASKDQLRSLSYTALTKSCSIGELQSCEKYFDIVEKLSQLAGDQKFRIDARLSMVRKYTDKGDSSKARELLHETAQLLQKSDYPRAKARYHIEKSMMSRQGGNLNESIEQNDLALAAISQVEAPYDLSNIYSNRGRTFRYMGEMDSARTYYEKAEAVALDNNIEILLSTIYNNLGNIGHIGGKYDEAIEYYLKSIAIKEKSNNIRGLSIGYHNIGAIKNDMKAYMEAIKEFNKSDVFANEIQFKNLNAHNAVKTGFSYQMMEDYETALSFHEKAYKIASEIDFRKVEITALIGMGIDRLRLGSIESAQVNLFEALELAEAMNNKAEECSALVAIAEWYTAATEADYDISRKVSFRNIESMLIRAKDLSDKMNYGEKKILVYEGLLNLYKASGNHKSKAVALEEYMALKDSLYAKDRTTAITEWETKYSTAEKEKEIIQLEADNKIAKFTTRVWQYVLAGVALVFVLFTLFGFKYLNHRNERKRLEEADMFRSKLSSDLHDDVGTMLSSLAMQSDVMVLSANPDQVEKFEKLSHLSRKAMGRMRDTVWAIDARKDKTESLLDRMKDYISDMLNGHQLNVNFQHDVGNIEKRIRPDVRQNIYLIFKEAINNAAKYSNGDKLTVRFSQNDGNVNLYIHDNGTIDERDIKKSGTGLSNMRMRAKRIKGQFNMDVKDGFTLTVSAPI